MTQGQLIVSTLMALAVSGTLAAAQAPVNFAGIWKSDNAKNPAVLKGLVTNVDLEIRQNETAIGIIQGKVEAAYKLDGSPSTNGNGVSTVTWTGHQLVINEFRGARRILTISGNELTVEWFGPANTGNGPADVRMIYRKAP
jgi:hypothetical protein